MEFDEIVVKESPGLCRCCLSEGCYKDMGTEYAWMNENEVYADMLFECFDISISQLNDGPNGPNRLICEVCITRLRDACYFKKQVLESEKKFVDMVGRGEFKPKAMIVNQSNMKTEKEDDFEVTFEADEAEVEYLEDEMDYIDDEALKTEEPSTSVSDVTAEALPVRSKRGRPRKAPTKPVKKVKAEPKAKSSKALVKGRRIVSKKEIKSASGSIKEDPANKKDAITKRPTMKQKALQVLTKSTIMPFKWSNSSFRCFYCLDEFQDPEDLRLHQIVHTSYEDKQRAMMNFWEPHVFVEVSDLSCSVCSIKIDEFDGLIKHLMEVHDVIFRKDVGYMRPFKLKRNSVQCVKCEKEYKTFGDLLVRGNKCHNVFSDIKCEICGQYYQTTRLLGVHMDKEHGKKHFECQLCGDIFTNITRRSHLQNVHNKKYKCLICSKLFDTLYQRSCHVKDVHEKKKKVKCSDCGRTFVFQSAMLRHVREKHLQEKNVICSVCGWTAFNEGRLKTHMSKHTEERRFMCSECGKSFKNMKTTKKHIKNVHLKLYYGP